MPQPSAAHQPRSRAWRGVDIITAAVLGVACGLIFWIWNGVGGAGYGAFDAITPGLGGLFNGGWVLAAVLGGLIIRKPGAALFVEVVAASVSALIGNQWGIETLYSGVVQGLGAELVFALFAYRAFSMKVAVLAGMAAGAAEWALELVTSGNFAMSLSYNLIYLACTVASGAVLAGVVGFALMKGLAATGALDRFAAGREHRDLV
ncbi:MAG TPA: ECF transporter S component [Candidatus Corynebacterium gallistercoris]|uniref:ECF transporter S component n=1 Tax=Candidatus Corynebacterium gallistercoris TaxID=2838530 RepID=A0A9D1UQI9_9CORY|nr:ECF transporter S component [Candidatus Corynebacterium gallistercoris]